jgi:hypothetical protein
MKLPDWILANMEKEALPISLSQNIKNNVLVLKHKENNYEACYRIYST